MPPDGMKAQYVDITTILGRKTEIVVSFFQNNYPAQGAEVLEAICIGRFVLARPKLEAFVDLVLRNDEEIRNGILEAYCEPESNTEPGTD
jgi:hypothetical protein